MGRPHSIRPLIFSPPFTFFFSLPNLAPTPLNGVIIVRSTKSSLSIPSSDQHFLFSSKVTLQTHHPTELTHPVMSPFFDIHLFSHTFLYMSLTFHYPSVLLSIRVIILSVVVPWGNPYLLSELSPFSVPVTEKWSAAERSGIPVLTSLEISGRKCQPPSSLGFNRADSFISLPSHFLR